MNRRGFHDDAPPWSFFLPITLAVVVGILAADAVRLAIDAVFVRETRETAETRVPARTRVRAPSADPAEPEDTTVPAPAPAAAAPPAPPAPPTAAEADAPGLPGPISAMRDRDERACINGTIADRKPNGWEQAMEDDAPLRCTATSP